MESIEYLAAYVATVEKNYPDQDQLIIENYLETFATLPPLLRADKKCPITSEEYRLKGNTFYMNGSYEDAAAMYTCSLREAPPYSKYAALAYGNRSAVSYHLGAYEDCILDVDRALDLPYPNDLRTKIISRKEASVANLNNTRYFTNENMVSHDSEQSHKENAKLSGFSQGIDIADGPQNKPKLVAKMPFKIGDVLLVQNPYLTVMNLKENSAHCHYCLKKSLSLVPCDRCTDEIYCSEKCRTEAYENHHRIECTIQSTLMSALPLDRQSLLIQLRCLNILTEQGSTLNAVYDDVEEIENNSDPVKFGFTGEKFVGNTRKAFLSLVLRKKIKYTSANMFEAAYIVTLLRNHTNFFTQNTDVPLVVKLLLKLSNAYISNHFPLPYFGKPDIKAYATYPSVSLINHACVNNTITYINKDGRIVLRASQDIRPGDEILCSYDVCFFFEDRINRSGKMLQCKRYCKQCDKAFLYPPEKLQHVKMDRKLRATLQKDSYDIEGLWKLLNIVHGKHQRYTLQEQIVKLMLVTAYEGRSDHGMGSTYLNSLNIL